MRSILARLGLLILAGCLAACDLSSTTGEEDPDVVAQAEIVLDPLPESLEAGTLARTAVVEGADGLVPGRPVQAETLVVQQGARYQGRIVLYGGDRSPLTARLKNQAEWYQLFYRAPAGVTVEVTDAESTHGTNRVGDDLPVGLTFEVTVSDDVAIADVQPLRVRLFHFSEQAPKDGGVPGFDPEADFVIPIRFAPPGPERPVELPLITSLRIRLSGFTFMVGDDRGLNRGDTLLVVPSLGRGIGSDGAIELFDAQGAALHPIIHRDRNFYEFEFTRYGMLADVLTFLGDDQDYHGRPLGLHLFYYVTQGEPLAEWQYLRIRLLRYDPDRGQRKGDPAAVPPDALVDVLLPLRIV